jgi:hypothetical protein
MMMRDVILKLKLLLNISLHLNLILDFIYYAIVEHMTTLVLQFNCSYFNIELYYILAFIMDVILYHMQIKNKNTRIQPASIVISTCFFVVISDVVSAVKKIVVLASKDNTSNVTNKRTKK